MFIQGQNKLLAHPILFLYKIKGNIIIFHYITSNVRKILTDPMMLIQYKACWKLKI